MPDMTAAAQLIRLDAQGFAVSAGSACSSGASRQSHVMAALGLPAEWSANVIRVSFGPATTVDEVAAFADAWTRLALEARSRAA
jgi:cysteine desulfurase